VISFEPSSTVVFGATGMFPTLKRTRLLAGMKQSHVAELLGVTQSTVSRWEAGLIVPEPEQARALRDLFARRPAPESDAALKRLVESSSASVHLICDTTHRLLATSPSRSRRWRGGVAEYLGRPLIFYASPLILKAEESISEMGWFEGETTFLRFETDANTDPDLPIEAGVMLWERMPLSDGSMGRLVTSL